MSISILLADIDTQVTSTNQEVRGGGGGGGERKRAIYVSHAYIYEPLQSKILVHKEK